MVYLFVHPSIHPADRPTDHLSVWSAGLLLTLKLNVAFAKNILQVYLFVYLFHNAQLERETFGGQPIV